MEYVINSKGIIQYDQYFGMELQGREFGIWSHSLSPCKTCINFKGGFACVSTAKIRPFEKKI